jgi:sigma-B regulation protein RsbU (phosphoserine phosphatase)
MELEIAKSAQLRMLPQEPPQISNLDIAVFMAPAKEVGADYYDFIPISNNRLGIVIGDVSGKGMPAALYMTLMKGFIQFHAGRMQSPRDILCSINRNFYLISEKNVFRSIFYCFIDTNKKKMVYSRAGYNPISIMAMIIKPRGCSPQELQLVLKQVKFLI